MARVTSGIPGPSSVATTTSPRCSPSSTARSVILPRPAYCTMLRAISEMAVARMVRSLPENPTCSASSRPRWRAVRMSCSEPMSRRLSSPIGGPPPIAIEDGQPFLQVEPRRHAVQAEAELDHREGDLGLHPHDDRLRAPQLPDARDVEERPDGERVEHLGRGDVHDDAARAALTDALRQVVLELTEIGVGDLRL